MTHRVNSSSSARLGGFTGRVLAIAAATALCVAAIAVSVSMCSGPSTDPRPVVAPSGSLRSTEVAPSASPSSTAPSSPALASTTAPSAPSPTPPPTTVAPPEPVTTAPAPVRTAPRVTTPAPTPRCTPQPKWVFRPSTGTYERITIPC